MSRCGVANPRSLRGNALSPDTNRLTALVTRNLGSGEIGNQPTGCLTLTKAVVSQRRCRAIWCLRCCTMCRSSLKREITR